MHLVTNLTNLMLSLWRGTIKCNCTDNKNTWDWAVLCNADLWDEHGELVALAGHHLPGSFDRKPCNIAEKINTQYKTWEYQLYMYGIAPGMQLMWQHCIAAQQVQEAHMLLCSLEWEFKKLYYQQKEDCLHLVRPCAHQVPHLPNETLHKGPPICYIQWTMERMIGNLGQEIQPSNSYENLSQEGHPIQKWAQVQLPNGQIAQCVWSETLIPPDKLRVSHNVKFLLGDSITFGEVQYFTQLSEWIGLLDKLVVMNIKQICSIIEMVSHTPTLPSGISEGCFFLVERPSLDVSDLGVFTLVMRTMMWMPMMQT
ncbi:hypothetical protein BS17DRAFT_794415 [Gyrodon lividus]|nr:hypothetical protein BS17DRAFT_794415 [Gyrodon lividus]